MNKPIQLHLFCSEESFRSQFAARLLTFYGTTPKVKQENSLSEDDIISKLQSEQHIDMPMRFFIDQFEFEIVWKNDIQIEKGKEKENNITLFLLLLELKQKISQNILQTLQEYEISKNSFFVIIDKISDNKKDAELQSYESDVLDTLNNNLNVLVNDTHILTVLPEISESSKILICDKFKQIVKSIFEVSHIKVDNYIYEDSLDDALRKMCSQYGIEEIEEFIEEVKNGEFKEGCARIKDRKARKALMETLTSFTLLNEFVLQKQKSKELIKSKIMNQVNKSQHTFTSVESSKTTKIDSSISKLQDDQKEIKKKVEETTQIKSQEEETRATYDENGDRYEGEYKNGKRDGEGTLFYVNGDKYIGEFKNGLSEGNGIYIYAQGDKYIGDWKNGLMEGKGIFMKPNGVKYEGQWKNGLMDGKGTYFSPDGDRYEGQWKNDKMEGKGTYVYSNGGKYVGQWKNGNREGKGTYVYASGSKYEGEYKNGKIEGKGTYIYADGGKYAGQFKNDQMEGRGTYVYVDGGKYQGQWKNSKKQGKGTFFHADGSKYQGQWKNSKKNGKGIETYAKGKTVKGIWKNNIRDDCNIF